MTNLTLLSGYQKGEPLGHGECIVQGDTFQYTLKLPGSVSSPGRPVVT